MSDVLTKIIAKKYEEVAKLKKEHNIESLLQDIKYLDESRPFAQSLLTKMGARQPAVIAEIKKASPSKGIIRNNFDPIEIAKSYANHQATCLSVITDRDFFMGDKAYLSQVRGSVSLPVLRKDFMVDEMQIVESKKLGADAILLIVAALDEIKLKDLNACANECGLDVLVEVHAEQELEVALELPKALLGINNRNLKDFSTTLDTTLDLLKMLPANKKLITESGIAEKKDVEKMCNAGVYGFLVGEAFMRQDDPGQALEKLFY